MNLYIMNEIITNNLNYNSLTIISIISILCGVFVIISKNPIVSVLFLIGLFVSIACYLMVLGINFIGLSYLLVYVGAVSILFLFILMLINVRISELVVNSSNSIPLAIMIGIFFISNLLLPHRVYRNIDLSFAKMFSTEGSPNFLLINEDKLYYLSSNIWDSKLSETSHITSIGNVIYTAYPLWLILTSIILLLAMVGAIVITIKQ